MTGMPSRASLTAAATIPRHAMPLIDPSLLTLLPDQLFAPMCRECTATDFLDSRVRVFTRPV